MKNIIYCIAVVTMLEFSGGSALGSEQDLPLVPAYIEQRDGNFAVCALDGPNDTLFKYRGLFIPKNDLPKISIMRSQLIFAQKNDEREVVDPSEEWRPRQRDMYFYGKIPYNIVTIDPPIDFCVTEKSELLLGVRLRERFYAFANVGEITKESDYKFRVLDCTQSIHIIHVAPPEHRKGEIGEYIKSIREKGRVEK